MSRRIFELLPSPGNKRGWRAADSASLRDCWKKQGPENRFSTLTNTTSLLRTIQLGKEEDMLSTGTRKSAVPITHIHSSLENIKCKGFIVGYTVY